ncbi:hypothetical protein BHE74_00028780 [Ensete ventricosum]|uniref:Uncharacterized protein n=1 Tax=Ensete ventricosum TaxID=4639 RepID=A0A444CZ98_ENSVE|nr:hypothetical protein GW17_00046504 [Ensete ventricosum]RWW64007.1 hypothetical protein BHE74_00028780 [Ensete ventricosum]RZR74209.1 hypothetical protein BHM03_00033763 [Ensete ventricosum]
MQPWLPIRVVAHDQAAYRDGQLCLVSRLLATKVAMQAVACGHDARLLGGDRSSATAPACLLGVSPEGSDTHLPTRQQLPMGRTVTSLIF